jgi:hypothetical protein
VSTTSPKFGTGSAAYAGTGSSLTTAAGLTDFDFGAGQFTVEAQAFWTSNAAVAQSIFGRFQGASNLGWELNKTAAGLLSFFYSTTGTDSPSVGAAFTPTLNTWYHVAADRDASNVLRVYVNGAIIASATVSSAFFVTSLALSIGNDGNATRGFPGRLDEIRITKGTAQYGGAFTPPTGPFSSPILNGPIVTMIG